MRFAASLVALALVLGLAACDGDDDGAGRKTESAPLTVSTSSGRLHGLATATAREFLGVRYGRAERWSLPTAATAASGTVQATKAGPSCAQAGTAPGASATSSASEDCLFLDVTTPKRLARDEKLPVMVWWHGGGFTSGSGAAYDAQRLADRGRVVVVSVNYRLGVFGYLSLPGLAGSGDFGFADQILATRWAKTNAAAFGGDPDNITVFGESAGAMSACALLSSPAATGLVDKVALSSGGSCQLRWPQNGLLPGLPPQTPYTSLADGQKFGLEQAGTLGCPSASALACLRAKSTKDLLTIFANFSNLLAYGTPLLPRDPRTAVQDGAVLSVPVLSGNNHDEERAFVGGVQKAKPTYTAVGYPTLIRQAFGSEAAAVSARYPLASHPSAADAWATVITDSSWACPTLRGNADLAANGAPVYAYEFDDPQAPDVNGVTTSRFAPKAAHASDVPYLFDLLGRNLLRTGAQRALANAMIDYWTSFARTGTPVADGEAAWPRLEGVDGPVLRLSPTRIAVSDVAADHKCNFWRTITY